MKFTWITLLLDQKGIVLMSVGPALLPFLPSLEKHFNDLFFVILGWIIAMLLTFVEHWTSLNKTKKEKELSRKELWSKFIVYTMIFFVLKFFHLWTAFEHHEYLSISVSFLVMLAYAIIILGEFKFIGQNLDQRYGKKPSIFGLFDKLEKAIMTRIVRKVESGCNLDSQETTKVTKKH